MRAKELIIGHYEGSLTPAEQQELNALLASSPEARAAYERHGVIEETLEEDARRMVVPVGLREATVAAAIGVSAETVGWGVGGWLTAKVAAVIGTVVVGGTILGVVVANDDEDPTRPTPASVSTNPTEDDAGDSDPLKTSTTTDKQDPASAIGQSNKPTSVTDRNAAGASSSIGSNKSEDAAGPATKPNDLDEPDMSLGGGPEVLIPTQPKIQNDSLKQ